MQDNLPYVTILEGIGCFLVVIMVWDHTEEDYKIGNTSHRYKTKKAAGERAIDWATQRGLEIR